MNACVYDYCAPGGGGDFRTRGTRLVPRTQGVAYARKYYSTEENNVLEGTLWLVTYPPPAGGSEVYQISVVAETPVGATLSRSLRTFSCAIGT